MLYGLLKYQFMHKNLQYEYIKFEADFFYSFIRKKIDIR